MLDDSMRISLLPEYLIVHDFVHGVENCNYEKYLIELLNNSKYFLDLGKSEYYHPKNENNGECDAISDSYSLDFKLAASTSMMQAKSILTPQVFTMGGLIFHSVPKVQNGEVRAVCLHTALRDKSKSELLTIRQKETNDFVEQDIKAFLRVLETDKNILLFYPCIFEFETNYDFDEGVMQIIEGMSHDFSNSIGYRESVIKNKDTYFSCVYKNQMVFLKCNNKSWTYVDCVPLNKSQTYQDLLKYKAW